MVDYIKGQMDNVLINYKLSLRCLFGSYRGKRFLWRITLCRFRKRIYRIYYEEVGSGFPYWVFPGGGLNSVMSSLETAHPFNPKGNF
ncbi:MAG: hypothetical protein CM1200mP35_00930 [Chloroflexota bacterium]|nr:MAG: hypothetical protein CM1200mP35_00930 [Chloroflexota bacterium]